MSHECHTGSADLRQHSGTGVCIENERGNGHFGWRDTGVWRKALQEPGQRDGASGPAPQGDGPNPEAAGRAVGRGADHGGALGTRPDPAATVAAAHAGEPAAALEHMLSKTGLMSISDGGMLAMQDGAVTNGAVKRGRLAQRRKAVGLTQEQLAGQLGVERTTVVRWERGQTQPLPWLRPRLAKALGVSAGRIEELLASTQGRAARVPRQLPASVADFTGRTAELQALTQMFDQPIADSPGTVVISAIGGT